jgi:GMP synthase-like glutamine amidotransferase
MKILLIDNGTKLLTKLQDLIPGSEVTKGWKEIVPSDINNFDLVILSGSSSSSVVWNHQDFENEVQLIKETKKPIIGICFGCELIAYAFGGSLKQITQEHRGIREIEILDIELFKDKKIRVYEHHKWIIDKIPEHFVVLAKSVDGPEAIRHMTLPIYGLQFHPENFVDETEGDELFLTLLSHF